MTQNTRNSDNPWKVDLIKFRIFLKEKYLVEKAYYYIGVWIEKNVKLYNFLTEAGYEVVFREHDARAKGIKKTNVDTDIVYDIMRHAYRDKDCEKIVLVSNDGDYKKTVSCLLNDDKLKAIMFPGANWSALYRELDETYKVKLYIAEIKKRIVLK